MAMISRQIREILEVVVFLLVVGVLLTAYVIYPLNRSAAVWSRADIEEFNIDSLPPNDITAFEEFGLMPDSFRIEADGLTNLACVYLAAGTDSTDSSSNVSGTVALLHADNDNRDSMLVAASMLHDAGYNVVMYDQRASRLSSGKYHGDGQFEAADLAELIRYLDLRDKISHPLIVVGYELGADAAMLAEDETRRIDGVIAIDPYLTSLRMQDKLREKYDTYWFPFYRTIMWWWYGMRSGYDISYREIEHLNAVEHKTLLFVGPDELDDPEVLRLKELAPANLLEIHGETPTQEDLLKLVERIASP